MVKKKCFLLGAFLAISVLFAGCGAPDPAPGSGNDEPSLPLMGKVEMGLEVNGSSTGYPSEPIRSSGVEVHLAHDGTRMYVHARAESQGWIAVGFNGENGGMNGANMMLGTMDESGTSWIRNDLGQGTRHSPIEGQGIVEGVVVQEGNEMIMEFSYPIRFPDAGFAIEGLNPGDTYSLILAINARSDDLSRTHSSRGQVNFRME